MQGFHENDLHVLKCQARWLAGPEVAAALNKTGRLPKRVEPASGTLFEEPCPYGELEWTAEVAAALKMNVAGGEGKRFTARRWKSTTAKPRSRTAPAGG